MADDRSNLRSQESIAGPSLFIGSVQVKSRAGCLSDRFEEQPRDSSPKSPTAQRLPERDGRFVSAPVARPLSKDFQCADRRAFKKLPPSRLILFEYFASASQVLSAVSVACRGSSVAAGSVSLICSIRREFFANWITVGCVSGPGSSCTEF